MLKKSLFIGIGLSWVLQFANAESITGYASVMVLETLEISESNQVDFGAIPGDNGTCEMSNLGELNGLNGSNCGGNGQVGSFVINGTVGQSINISVTTGDGPAGLSFQPQLLSGSTATLAGGSATALIGGQLALNDAPRGNQSLTYFITVNYN